MKIVSFLTGIKPGPPPEPRGFFGIEVAEKDGKIVVDRVLARSPAAEAGLMPGDRIDEVEGQQVETTAQLLAATAKITPDRPLGLTVTRNGEKQSLKITAGRGL